MKMSQAPENVRTVFEETKRAQWDNKVQYLLSCIGFVIGFGNMWRFPYLCQVYGGGAFLIPYLIALVFEGIPIFYLEIAIGQTLRKGSIGAWNQISPYLGGLGVASLTLAFLVSLYYTMILAWVFWFFINSFQQPLPWSFCPQNPAQPELAEECNKTTTTNYYWYRHTLNISTDITESGPLLWWMVTCLAASWTIVYLCTIRGIESVGKAIYLTSTFPCVILSLFVIYGLCLPGATEGLIYFFTPKVNIFTDSNAWLAAATQIFFSLSLAFGGHIAFASYNPPRNNCEVDAILIAIINSLTSMYASIPVFSILGFKATLSYEECLHGNIKLLVSALNLTEGSITVGNYTASFDALNKLFPQTIAIVRLKKCNIQQYLDQTASGIGLAFIVFTEVVTKMPGSHAWSCLFFFMLFSLGLSSLFGLVQSIMTSLIEFRIVSKHLSKEATSGIICLSAFSLGLCFTLRSGSYWVQAFDTFAGSVPLLIIGFFEVIGVTYVHGLTRFCDNVQWMTQRPVHLFWKASWQIISPVLMFTVLVAYAVLKKPSTYDAWNPNYEHFPAKETKMYPGWVVATCVTLAVLPCLFIPLGAIYQFGRTVLKKKQQQVLYPDTSSENK
uniref:Transporter n=1 Tax=Salvator merianae TaxID=96440 RepID=A0A8D0CAV9_SALMN